MFKIGDILKTGISIFLVFVMLISVAGADNPAILKTDDTKKIDNIKNETIDKTSKSYIDFTNTNIIGVKISEDATELNKYTITKTGHEIKIHREDPTVNDKKQHTKVKLQFDEKTFTDIDVDKDGVIGYLRSVDGSVQEYKEIKISDITTGKKSILVTELSDVVIDGHTGYYIVNSYNVTSGSSITIGSSSGYDSTTMTISGTVPASVTGIPTSGLWAHYPLNSNANDDSGNNRNGVAGGITYSNGGAVFGGPSSKSNISLPSMSPAVNASFTIVADADMDYCTILSQGATLSYDVPPGFRFGQYGNYISDYNTFGRGHTPTVNNNRHIAALTYNSTHLASRTNGVKDKTTTISGIPYLGTMANNAKIGARLEYDELIYSTGTVYDLAIYSRALNLSENTQTFTKYGGVSITASPYTGGAAFMPYNVSSGTEKTITLSPVPETIKLYNTAFTTLSHITFKKYFQENYTLVTENVIGSTYHCDIQLIPAQNSSGGTIIKSIIPTGFYGTATLNSTDTGASINQNSTHFTITTGALTAGSTYTYNVEMYKYRTESRYQKVGAQQNVSQTMATNYNIPSDGIKSLTIDISTTAGSDPYSEIAATNPTAWYKLDNTTGSTIIDSSGHGYNGIAYNSPTWVTGKYNNAMYFDGVNDYTTTTVYPSNESGTIITTFKVTAPGENASYIFGCINSSAPIRRCYISLDASGKISAGIGGSSYGFLYSDIVPQINRYYVVEAKYNTSTIVLLVDNQIKMTLARTGSVPVLAMSIGAARTQTAAAMLYTNCVVDNTLYYNRMLNTTEDSIIYYDILEQLRAKSNANSTYSTYWNSTDDNNLAIPYDSSDGAVSSISFNVPVNVTQNGVTIRYYNQTVSPFTPTLKATISNTTGDNYNIVESVNSQRKLVNFKHQPGHDYTGYTIFGGRVAGYLGPVTLQSNQSAATLSRNDTSYMIETGALTANEWKYYNVTMQPTGTDKVVPESYIVVSLSALAAAVAAYVYQRRDRRR